MAYTEQLKRAQLAKLKQRYLDLMEEAGRENSKAQQRSQEEKQQLYTERMLQLRDLPQQLAAAGSSGGARERALQDIERAYRDGLSALEQAQKEYLEQYSHEVKKQNRLMQLAVEEYLARVSASGRKSSGSKSSSKSSSTVTAVQTQQGPQPSRSRTRLETLAIPAASGSGWRTMQSK